MIVERRIVFRICQSIVWTRRLDSRRFWTSKNTHDLKHEMWKTADEKKGGKRAVVIKLFENT